MTAPDLLLIERPSDAIAIFRLDRPLAASDRKKGMRAFMQKRKPTFEGK